MAVWEALGAGAGLAADAFAVRWLEGRRAVDVCQLELTFEVCPSVGSS